MTPSRQQHDEEATGQPRVQAKSRSRRSQAAGEAKASATGRTEAVGKRVAAAEARANEAEARANEAEARARDADGRAKEVGGRLGAAERQLRNRRRIDIGAVVALIIAIATGIVAWASAQAESAGLEKRVETLESQLNGAREEATRIQRRLAEVEKASKEFEEKNQQFITLVTDLVEKGKVSQLEVLRLLGSWPGGTPPDQVLQITRPSPTPADAEPTRVPAVVTARGAIHQPLEGRRIWVLISTPGINRLYPQGSWPERIGPASVTQDGRWISPSVYLGDPKKDKGRHFDIIAVLANRQAESKLWAYLKRGARSGSFPGITRLPQGAEEYDRVEVVRA